MATYAAIRDKNKYLAHLIATRSYYKYQYISYVRPNLTSDTGNPELKVSYSSGGTIWGSAYNAFDGDTSTFIHSYQSGGGLSEASLYMEFDKPICITGLTGALLATASANPYGQYTVYVYTSNDGVNYDLIYTSDFGTKTTLNESFTNTTYCKYYRIRMWCGGWDDHDEVGACEIYPVGTIKTIVPGTSTDYDFYTSEYTCKTYSGT